MNFFVLLNGETKGPFSGEELLDMKSLGEIDDNTNICLEGTQTWLFFSTACELIKNGKERNMQGPVVPSPITPVGRKSFKEEESSNSQIAGAFRGVGIVCFVLAVIVPLVLRYGYGINLPTPFMMLTVGAGEFISAGVIGMILLGALSKYKNVLFRKKAAV